MIISMIIKKYILPLTLTLGVSLSIFGQSNSADKAENKIIKNKVTLGSKGSKELSGSISAHSHNYKGYNNLGFDLYFGLKYYPANNFYLGINPNFGFIISTSQRTYGMSLSPSLSTGVLFPFNKKGLFFNLEADFNFNIDWYTSNALYSFTPSLITSIKQDLGTLVVNYLLIHTYSHYSNYTGNNPQWDNFYTISFAIGLSFYF